jgi:nucleoside-diphosphate-sugar epimerase
VATTIRRRFQNFQYEFAPDPVVEALLSGWPNVMADDVANKDWGWKPAFDFTQSADRMFELLDAEKR